jgi:hypothetical protein
MLIYTGNSIGGDVERVKAYGMGIMIASSPTPGSFMDKRLTEVPCALDNGAFTSKKKGYPFNPYPFLATMAKCQSMGLVLDFVVCPDIPGSPDSLAFSLKWATGQIPGTNLALALQDGMTTDEVRPHLRHFSTVFVGGSVDWKWRTAETWAQFAKDEGKRCHIGQVGTVERLRRALELGVDSVDSTSFVRNDSWHILDEFFNPRQMRMDL